MRERERAQKGQEEREDEESNAMYTSLMSHIILIHQLLFTQLHSHADVCGFGAVLVRCGIFRSENKASQH